LKFRFQVLEARLLMFKEAVRAPDPLKTNDSLSRLVPLEIACAELEDQGLKGHELEQIVHAGKFLFNDFNRFIVLACFEQRVELQHRRATPINGYEALLNARKILGRILTFPIKNKAGAYEQPGLGNFLNSRKLLDVGRLALGTGGKESDKLFERLSCLFPLLFLHLTNSPPKQQVLTVRYLNGRIASERFPDRVEGLGKPLQTHEAHREWIAYLPDDRLGIAGGPEVRDEFSIHLRRLAVFPLRVER
jgi:hypothetical protein